MSLIGRLHPLLVHFPIALVLAAAAAEFVAIARPRQRWRTIAVANVRAGAAMGAITAISGWLLASSPIVEATPSLEWHRWVGMAGAAGAVGAALMASRLHGQSSRRSLLGYRVALFATALLIVITGHLGGTLVWGNGFLRP
jgi:uncharacterized membrane protein